MPATNTVTAAVVRRKGGPFVIEQLQLTPDSRRG